MFTEVNRAHVHGPLPFASSLLLEPSPSYHHHSFQYSIHFEVHLEFWILLLPSARLANLSSENSALNN
jgi:hypothetical protein